MLHKNLQRRRGVVNYRIPNFKHYENEWFVQKIAGDFLLEDVWELPLRFNKAENDSLHVFRKNAVEPMIKGLFNSTLSGMLFRLRGVLGGLWGIDKKINELPIPGCRESSLAERMAAIDRHKHKSNLDIDLQTDTYLDFQTVYSFEDETLDELSNSTEHSLMHWAWVKEKGDIYKVQMAVLVKHRNRFGEIYMKLIRPFRHNIVYPYVFGESIRLWNVYKRRAQFLVDRR
jgi:hypothetical protein